MYLLFFPQERFSTTISLYHKGGVAARTFEGRSKLFLKTVDELLREHSVSVADVRGVAVVLGTGSFTATRVATTIANTLSLAVHTPLAAIESHDITASDPASWFKASVPGQLMSARYSAQAHIGK